MASYSVDTLNIYDKRPKSMPSDVYRFDSLLGRLESAGGERVTEFFIAQLFSKSELSFLLRRLGCHGIDGKRKPDLVQELFMYIQQGRVPLRPVATGATYVRETHVHDTISTQEPTSRRFITMDTSDIRLKDDIREALASKGIQRLRCGAIEHGLPIPEPSITFSGHRVSSYTLGITKDILAFLDDKEPSFTPPQPPPKPLPKLPAKRPKPEPPSTPTESRVSSISTPSVRLDTSPFCQSSPSPPPPTLLQRFGSLQQQKSPPAICPSRTESLSRPPPSPDLAQPDSDVETVAPDSLPPPLSQGQAHQDHLALLQDILGPSLAPGF